MEDENHRLTQVINARGTFTALGVSRSSDAVAKAVTRALADFFIMDELQEVVSEVLASFTGAEAGTVVHCTAAAITLSVAAAMTGISSERVQRLPDTQGVANLVIVPAGHVVNYGHSILQDVRLAGAEPVVVGSDAACTLEELEEGLARQGAAALLLVSSRLARGKEIPFDKAVALAHKRGVPAIIDGAAQDFRLRELVATGADLVLVSGQKYLASPTAGLVIGKAAMVKAVRAQEKGIGRSMKASKEAILGVLAAIEERQAMDLGVWTRDQSEKVACFVDGANKIAGIHAAIAPDPTGLPFPRATVKVDPSATGLDAESLAAVLENGTPPIWLMRDKQEDGELVLELVSLTLQEVDVILHRLSQAMHGAELKAGAVEP